MKSANIIAVFLLLNALLSTDTRSSLAAQARDSRGQHIGHAAPQINSNGSADSKHQWFADPERGWVRRDESHGANDQGGANKQRNQGRAQSNNKGKKF